MKLHFCILALLFLCGTAFAQTTSTMPRQVTVYDTTITKLVTVTNCPPIATNTPPPVVTNSPPPIVTNIVGQLTIPSTHPRIMLGNTATYNKLHSYWQVAPFAPADSDPFSNAMVYQLTRNPIYAQKAITWLMAYQIPAGQALPSAVGSDASRWDGENAVLVYDWCHDQMTAAQRSTIVSRWNTWLGNINQQSWGGVGMEMNNYYWGNLRNGLLWALATWGENLQAQSFLDHALVTRWQNSFLPLALGAGKGGVPHEGPSYGAVMCSYPIIGFEACRLMGRNVWNETAFFQDAVKWLIYSTTPGKIVRKGQTIAKYELFPFNDYENYPQGFNVLTDRKYVGDFATLAANVWANTPTGPLARAWFNQVQPARTWFAVALDTPSSPSSFAALPLDYVTPLKAYSRTDWSANAVAWEINLGKARGVGHSHKDIGAVQGVGPRGWITRESAGYAQLFNGGDIGSAAAHNLMVFDGSHFEGDPPVLKQDKLVGPLSDSWQNYDPILLSITTNASALTCSVDLTGVYRATLDFAGRVPEAKISRYICAYTVLRTGELQMLFNVTATTSGTATFYLHSEVNPPRWTSTPATVLDIDEGVNGQFRFKIVRPLVQGLNTFSINVKPN